jgi:serine/threonine-protein kinase
VDGELLAETADPRIGRLMAGRYSVEAPIGTGGMATVYRGDEITSGRPVAIKVMHDTLADDAELRERFRREARTAAALSHENVVEILDAGETEDGHPFLVMELLEGETLRDMIKRGPLALDEVLAIGAQIARGLARAHDLGIVHRDLKPENVFVGRRDGEHHAKLVDFGIARSRDDMRLTAAGTILGTPAYLAPERVKGGESEPSADLYALGIVLFEMLTGRLPFVSESFQGFLFHHLETEPARPSELAPHCPPALESLILRLLSKSKKERPVDAHQVVRELEHLRGARSAGRASTPGVELLRKLRPSATRTSAPGAWGEAPRSAVSAGLDRWARRAMLLDEMVRRVWAGRTVPAEIARAAERLLGEVVRLESLRGERAVQQAKLDAIGARSRGAREQLGRAVHALGRDLSEARESLEALRAELARRELEVADLEFQIDVMRANLGETEAQAEAERAEAERSLAETGREIEAGRQGMGDAARVLIDALRAEPGGADLLADLD